jgi:hypothetical protein
MVTKTKADHCYNDYYTYLKKKTSLSSNIYFMDMKNY